MKTSCTVYWFHTVSHNFSIPNLPCARQNHWKLFVRTSYQRAPVIREISDLSRRIIRTTVTTMITVATSRKRRTWFRKNGKRHKNHVGVIVKLSELSFFFSYLRTPVQNNRQIKKTRPFPRERRGVTREKSLVARPAAGAREAAPRKLHNKILVKVAIALTFEHHVSVGSCASRCIDRAVCSPSCPALVK